MTAMKMSRKWIVAGIWMIATLTVHAEVKLSIRGSDTIGEE